MLGALGIMREKENKVVVAASAIKVMIVDDDEMMRKLTRRTLEKMGFAQIYAAKDGAEALDLARSQHPHVIISDYDMPTMHGLQFLKAIRQEPGLEKAGFIMLSGVANGAVVTKANELGADKVVMKPFSATDLKQKLEALVYQLTGSRIDWKLAS